MNVVAGTKSSVQGSMEFLAFKVRGAVTWKWHSIASHTHRVNILIIEMDSCFQGAWGCLSGNGIQMLHTHTELTSLLLKWTRIPKIKKTRIR